MPQQRRALDGRVAQLAVMSCVNTTRTAPAAQLGPLPRRDPGSSTGPGTTRNWQGTLRHAGWRQSGPPFCSSRRTYVAREYVSRQSTSPSSCKLDVRLLAMCTPFRAHTMSDGQIDRLTEYPIGILESAQPYAGIIAV